MLARGLVPRGLAKIPRRVPLAVRFNSSSQSGGSAPQGRGKLLVALGAMAIATTIASRSIRKSEPVAAKDTKQQAFSDKDVSVVFVLGGPGLGKGTQCSKLVKEKGLVHLSAGDLLREEQRRKGSKYGDLIAQCIKEGTIVPQEVTVALLEQAIGREYRAGNTRFLVDGFPRKMDQALTFEKMVVPTAFTLFFECPEAVMLQRLLERGKTSGRTDDNTESIKKRFKVFVETSMPVVDYFAAQGKLVKLRCDEPVDVVYGKVVQALEEKGLH